VKARRAAPRTVRAGEAREKEAVEREALEPLGVGLYVHGELRSMVPKGRQRDLES